MDLNEMLMNLRRAFARLCATRLIVSSPREKVADVPLLYAILLLIASPFACVLAFVLGLILHYGARLERDGQGYA